MHDADADDRSALPLPREVRELFDGANTAHVKGRKYIGAPWAQAFG
jgi:hypothetical protein